MGFIIVGSVVSISFWIYYTSKKSGIEENDKLTKMARKVDETKVSFDFLETPFEKAMKELTEKTGIPIKIDPELYKNEYRDFNLRGVILRVDNMRFKSALGWLCRINNMEAIIMSDGIFLTIQHAEGDPVRVQGDRETKR